MLRTLSILGMSGVIAMSAGCRHCCGKRVFGRGPSAPPAGVFLGSPVAPGNPSLGGATIPPPNVPTVPSSPPPALFDSSESLRTDPAYPPPPLTPPDFPPSDPPPTNRSFPPPASVPSPSGSGPELLLPDSLPPRSSGFGPTPSTPGLEAPVRPFESAEPPASIPLPTSGGDRPPPAASPKSTPQRTPIGLTGYQAVADMPGVFAGRRPTLDGFDWLKSNQFRTVLYLHSPAVDPGPAKALAETRGLAFESQAVDPIGLAIAAQQFNDAVKSELYRPLYVADDDGNRAGMLWYLHFRTVELLGDDAARVRASGLGLPSTNTELGKQYWIAAQHYLATRSAG